jgi:hypothetical protein
MIDFYWAYYSFSAVNEKIKVEPEPSSDLTSKLPDSAFAIF